MIKRKILAVGIILLAALVFLKFSIAQPPTFHQFYGNVLDVNGTSIGVPLIIEAFLNGSSIPVKIDFSDPGRYGYGSLFLVEGGKTGEIVDFYLDGYFAANYIYFKEGITNLNLVYNTSGQMNCVDFDEDGYNATGGACGVFDCNDANTAINPGATEICNSVDDNCDGQIDEGCGGSPPSSPSGGGGGGGGGTPGTFTITPNNFLLSLKQGETKQVQFIVTDSGIGANTVQVSSANIDMVKPTSATLPARGSVPISVDVAASLDKVPDIYMGHIDVVVKSTKKQIALNVEVASSENVFDVFLNTPDDLRVKAGEGFEALLTLTRLTETTTNDVILNFIVKDVDGNTVLTLTDTINVKDFAEFSKGINIPAGTVEGDYTLYVQADYDGKIASASKRFIVEAGGIKIDAGALWWILILALIVSIILVVVITYVVRAKERKMI